MQTVELPVEAMLPRILLVRHYDTVAMEHKIKKRVAEHYELSIYMEGNGTVSIRGAEYPISRGAVRFVPPGTLLSSVPDYRCISVYFDFGVENTVCHNPILDGIPCFFETACQQLPLFEALLKAYHSEQITARLRQNMLLMELLVTLFEEVCSKEADCDAVNLCIRYMREHFAEDITQEALGAMTGYSGLHLMRLFVRHTGRTPHKWLTAIRLLHAQKLLTETEKKLEQIAVECGFNSVSHFKTLFKRINSCSPGAYRKNTRKI